MQYDLNNLFIYKHEISDKLCPPENRFEKEKVKKRYLLGICAYCRKQSTFCG